MAEHLVMNMRSINGTVYSDSVPWDEGATGVIGRVMLSDQDLANPENHMEVCLEFSSDGGFEFLPDAKSNWVGGQVSPLTHQPAAPDVQTGFVQSMTLPTHVRVRMSTTISINGACKIIM